MFKDDGQITLKCYIAKLMFIITVFNFLYVLNFIICLFHVQRINLIAYYHFDKFQQRKNRSKIKIFSDLPTVIIFVMLVETQRFLRVIDAENNPCEGVSKRFELCT